MDQGDLGSHDIPGSVPGSRPQDVLGAESVLLHPVMPGTMDWIAAPDISEQIEGIVKKLEFANVDCSRIVCFRSHGSVSRAQARIWGLSRVWQQALRVPAHYVIEVLSERFDKLSPEEKTKVLIHELLHIPKNFSGSLLPHRSRTGRIDGRRVERLYRRMVAAVTPPRSSSA